MDRFSPEKRSNIMRGAKAKNTKPELRVRRMLHHLGYRYRLHHKGLPGKPDVVFPGRKKAIFVHGCFWHQHEDEGCPIVRRPESNTAYWNEKFERNVARDRRVAESLRELGWDVRTIWECQLSRDDELSRTLIQFLGPTNTSGG
jgi:DNA mismatch endonuclease (patch repair protein)